MDAIKRCTLIGHQSGVYALLVDARNEAVKRFYDRFGFLPIAGRPMTLYLPLETGLKAVQAAQRCKSAIPGVRPKASRVTKAKWGLVTPNML